MLPILHVPYADHDRLDAFARQRLHRLVDAPLDPERARAGVEQILPIVHVQHRIAPRVQTM